MSYILELFKLFGTTPKQKKNNFINVFKNWNISANNVNMQCQHAMSICNVNMQW